MKPVLAILLGINTVALCWYILHYIYCVFNPTDDSIKERLFFFEGWFGGYDNDLNVYTMLILVVDIVLLTILLTMFIANHL